MLYATKYKIKKKVLKKKKFYAILMQLRQLIKKISRLLFL